MLLFIYVISVIYCIWKMSKFYKKSYGPGNPIGPAPGLETMFIVVFAPVLAVVDVTLTWIRLVKESRDKNDNPVF